MKWLATLVALLLTLTPCGSQIAPSTAIRDLQTTDFASDTHTAEVSVEGVVTWADPTAGKYFYVQDSTGGIRVDYVDGSGPATGERLLVQGVLSPGSFSPLITKAKYSRLGPGRLPPPPLASGGGLLNGSYNGEWIKTDGWVRRAEFNDEGALMLILDSGGTRIALRITGAQGLDPSTMIASKVFVTGVASSVRSRGTTGQLVEVQVLVPRAEDLHFVMQEVADPWNKPYVALSRAFRYQAGQTRGDRLRVRGIVVMTSAEKAWIHDGESGLPIRGNISALSIGDSIEAVGFREMENYLPVLSDVDVRIKGEAQALPQPKRVQASELPNGGHHSDLVTISGHLLDLIETPVGGKSSRFILAFQSSQEFFTAELDVPANTPPGSTWQPGALLQVVGICDTQTDQVGNPSRFRILVPDTSSISVVTPAPYFTARRMLILLCTVLAALLALAILAGLLARHNASLKAEVHERMAIASERDRLARDLHDTLEQVLTGLQLQVKSMGISLTGDAEEPRKRLNRMRELIMHCRREVRSSIWNLRADQPEAYDLGKSLERMAQSCSQDSTVRIGFRQNCAGGKIPSLLADNLLRIAQEAMTNALKHARPATVEIELRTTPSLATLTVTDDGIGFSQRQTNTMYEGHFGLAGMRERCERIGATLRIISEPDAGTAVSAEVSLLNGSPERKYDESPTKT